LAGVRERVKARRSSRFASRETQRGAWPAKVPHIEVTLVANLRRRGRVIHHMTKRIVLPLAIVAGLLAGAAPANASPVTEELLGSYNFLLEAGNRPMMLQHGDFASFRSD